MSWSPPSQMVYYHLSPFNIITILWTIFPILYMKSLWLIYFITGSLCLLIPFTYFAHRPPAQQPPVCSLYLWICFCFVCLFCFLYSTYKWDHVVFVSLSVWLIPLSMIPSRSIHVVAKVRFHSFFYGWVVFLSIYLLMNI